MKKVLIYTLISSFVLGLSFTASAQSTPRYETVVCYITKVSSGSLGIATPLHCHNEQGTIVKEKATIADMYKSGFRVASHAVASYQITDYGRNIVYFDHTVIFEKQKSK